MARNPNRRRRRRPADADGAPARTGTPAPDPLKGAAPDVEGAKLRMAAEAEEGEISDAELEAAAEAAAAPRSRSRGGTTEAGAHEAHAPHRRTGALQFLRNSWEELKRVQWPDRRQVGQATAVVLGFVVLAGSWLGLMDAIWKPVVEAIL